MKITLNTSQVAEELFSDKENNGFTYAGCRALAEWLEEFEEETGEEMELDVVALRCDFSEHENVFTWADDYWGGLGKAMEGMNISESSGLDEDEETIAEYLRENTCVIKFEGGIIIRAF